MIEANECVDNQWLDVEKIAAICNPYESTVWSSKVVRKKDVQMAITAGLLESAPYCMALEDDWDHQTHVQRIAWLVANGWSDPIEVDVGIPVLGFHVNWPVTDGNHRLAAAIYRGDERILASVSGQVSYIEEFRWKENP